MARPMLKPTYVAAEPTTDYAQQAYMILKFGFTVLPVVTGLDMPVFPKRRFQHGAIPADAMRTRLGGTEQAYRRAFHGLYT